MFPVALVIAICLAINGLAGTITPGSSMIDDSNQELSWNLDILEYFPDLENSFPSDSSNVSTPPLQTTYNVPNSYITLDFTGPPVRRKISQTDAVVALTQFLVEAYRTGARGGSTALVPPPGLTRTYRHMQLGFRRRPGTAIPPRITDLVDVLAGTIYYMSYAPQGFTECDIDVYHRFQNPAIPVVLIAEFAIQMIEEGR